MRAIEKFYGFSQKELNRFALIFARRKAPSEPGMICRLDEMAATLGLDRGLDVFLSVTKGLRPLQPFEKRYHSMAVEMGFYSGMCLLARVPPEPEIAATEQSSTKPSPAAAAAAAAAPDKSVDGSQPTLLHSFSASHLLRRCVLDTVRETRPGSSSSRQSRNAALVILSRQRVIDVWLHRALSGSATDNVWAPELSVGFGTSGLERVNVANTGELYCDAQLGLGSRDSVDRYSARNRSEDGDGGGDDSSISSSALTTTDARLDLVSRPFATLSPDETAAWFDLWFRDSLAQQPSSRVSAYRCGKLRIVLSAYQLTGLDLQQLALGEWKGNNVTAARAALEFDETLDHWLAQERGNHKVSDINDIRREAYQEAFLLAHSVDPATAPTWDAVVGRAATPAEVWAHANKEAREAQEKQRAYLKKQLKEVRASRREVEANDQLPSDSTEQRQFIEQRQLLRSTIDEVRIVCFFGSGSGCALSACRA